MKTLENRLRPFTIAQVLLRMLADLVIITSSLGLATLIRFMWAVRTGEVSATSTRAWLMQLFDQLLVSALVIPFLSVVLLAILGVYTHTRVYRGRYKAFAIGEAIALAFVIFGIVNFVVDSHRLMSRSLLLIEATLSFIGSAGIRLWPAAWSVLNQVEGKLVEMPLPKPAKHILVIGGAGYIGSALLPKLLQLGYQVRLLDALLFGTEPIQEFMHHPNVEIVQADFRQVDRVVEAMRGIDAVVHLGAIVGDPACALDEDLTIEVNLSATRTIAEIAKGEGVQRFIFASTCSVYGASDETLDERSQLNPVSLYAKSKIAAEQVLMQLSDARFAPTILRFGTIYGLSGRTRFDLVVNLLTAKAIVDGVITVMGGDQWRPFVHVSDAALAVLKTLEAPNQLVRGETFNVGSNSQNYTIEGAAKVIHELVPNAKLLDMGLDGDRRNYRVSFDKINKTLDYQPEWTLAQGIQQVIDAIQSGKVRDYKDARYSNVKFLSEEGKMRLARPSMNWERNLIAHSIVQPEIAIAPVRQLI